MRVAPGRSQLLLWGFSFPAEAPVALWVERTSAGIFPSARRTAYLRKTVLDGVSFQPIQQQMADRLQRQLSIPVRFALSRHEPFLENELGHAQVAQLETIALPLYASSAGQQLMLSHFAAYLQDNKPQARISYVIGPAYSAAFSKLQEQYKKEAEAQAKANAQILLHVDFTYPENGAKLNWQAASTSCRKMAAGKDVLLCSATDINGLHLHHLQIFLQRQYPYLRISGFPSLMRQEAYVEMIIKAIMGACESGDALTN
jgi:hypothetical protein